MAQNVIRGEYLAGYIDQITITDTNHKPSWQRYGKGHSRIHVRKHREAGWLSIDCLEGGDKSYRETMVTLDEPAARELYAFLHERYGVET